MENCAGRQERYINIISNLEIEGNELTKRRVDVKKQYKKHMQKGLTTKGREDVEAAMQSKTDT